MPKSTVKDLGFLELSAGQDPVVDIVAIHGLDGHREESWTAEDGTMWLKDLLPNDFPQARILTYGYDADTRSVTRTSTQTIFRHAEAFAEDLSRQRRASPQRPIIFLAHSLGGIILKRALAHCHNHSFESASHLRDIIPSTLAVLFFGTPHAGANGTQLAEWMCRLASIYMSTSATILKDLNRDSFALEEIQALYLPASERIDTVFFYEQYATPVARGLAKKIVPRHLAVIAGDGKAKVVTMQADHCQLVKFTATEDGNYRKVIDYLKELLEQGPTKIRENWTRENAYRSIAQGEPVHTAQAVLAKPLLPVSRNYVHRLHIFDFITEKLLPADSTERQPRCVLHGLGGGGKTQLASSWIKAHKNAFSRIFVIDASSQHQIESDLQTAIRSIGPEYSQSTWKDTVYYLSSQKGWLLYFDNADSPNLRLEIYFPTSQHGAILITSRNRDCIAYARDSSIAVGMLAEKEAVDLLHKVANVAPSTNEMSLAIVRELGLWALAIAQAGAYILSSQRLETYLAIFRNHRDKLMRESPVKGENYEWSTYTAFDLSFRQLPTKAQEVMKICAFLHHSSIPLALFERSATAGFLTHIVEEACPPPPGDETAISHLIDVFGSEWDEYSFQKIINSISQRSLVDTSTSDGGLSFYHFHPLVQAYTRDLIVSTNHDLYLHSARQLLLGATRPLSTGENNSWHVQLSIHIDGLPASAKSAHVSYIMAFSVVYDSIGNWNAGFELKECCYSQLREGFGPQHLATMRAMSSLAAALRSCGRFDEAEKMGREVVQLQAEILEPDDPDRIAAMSKLAWTLCDCGQLEEAEKMGREVLTLQMEIFGSRHPDTVSSMAILAWILGQCGRLEEAEKMEREVLALQMEILGARHPNTVISIANLAWTLGQRGRLEEAEKMEQEVLALRMEILGARHPDTVFSMANLASTLGQCGRLEEEEKMEQEVLALQMEILGARHPDTLVAMANLAWTVGQRGYLEEAEKMQQEALALQMEILGARHPHTVISMANLAGTLEQLGQIDEAETMRREVLVLRTDILGPEHPDTIQAEDALSRIVARLATRSTTHNQE